MIIYKQVTIHFKSNPNSRRRSDFLKHLGHALTVHRIEIWASRDERGSDFRSPATYDRLHQSNKHKQHERTRTIPYMLQTWTSSEICRMFPPFLKASLRRYSCAEYNHSCRYHVADHQPVRYLADLKWIDAIKNIYQGNFSRGCSSIGCPIPC